MNAPGLLQRACVVGANGAFGRIFCRKLRAAGLRVTGIDRPGADPDPALAEFVAGDFGDVLTADAGRALLGDCDLLLFCTPENVAAQHLAAAISFEGISLYSDICSVKSGIDRAVRAGAAQRAKPFSHLSIHPMFGPTDDFTRLNLCIVPIADGAAPAAGEFRRIIGQWGARTVELSSEEHDRLTAWTQAACHFTLFGYGAALAGSGADWERLRQVATPAQEILLALVARVVSSSEDTYWQIQKENPFAAEARRQLLAAAGEVDAAARQASDAAFAEMIRRVAGHMAGASGRNDLKELSDHLAEQVRRAG